MILLILNLIAAAVILGKGVFFVINRMDRHTRHSIRFAWLVMTTGALGIVIAPLYGYAHPDMWGTALSVGVALYVVCDRRSENFCRGLS